MVRTHFLPLLLLCLAPGVARAEAEQRVPVTLAYTRGAGAGACPDESFFRDVVRGKAGFDPFPVGAPARLTVVITRVGRPYTARAVLRDAEGTIVWRREFAPMDNCASEVEGLGFAVAVKLDPEGSGTEMPAPAAAPPTAPTPPAAPAAPVMAVAPAMTVAPAPQPDHVARSSPTPPMVLRLGLAGAAGFGVSPAIMAAGVALDVGIRRSALSLSIEGRAFPGATGTAPGGAQVTTARYSSALVPCAHVNVFAGCALAEIGALHGSSDLQHPSATLLYAAAGIRGAVEVRLVEKLALRVAVDTSLAIQRSTFQISGLTAWTTPLVSGAVGAGLIALF